MDFEEESSLVIRWYYDETKILKDVNDYRVYGQDNVQLVSISKDLVKNNIQHFLLLSKKCKSIGFKDNISMSYNMEKKKMQLTIPVLREAEQEVKQFLLDFSDWLMDIMKTYRVPIVKVEDVEDFIKRREVDKSYEKLNKDLPNKIEEKNKKMKV